MPGLDSFLNRAAVVISSQGLLMTLNEPHAGSGLHCYHVCRRVSPVIQRRPIRLRSALLACFTPLQCANPLTNVTLQACDAVVLT